MPDISALHAAGSFSNNQDTIRVEMMPSKFVINRFGDSVPQLKPDPEARSQIPHLKYMALRGLADLPAIILEYAGLAYRATYYSRSMFRELKPTLEFGRLPVLEDEGMEIAQSSTIVRYLAAKCGLAGSGPKEMARVDSLYETFKDLFVSHGTWGALNVTALRQGPSAGEQVLHFRDTSNKGDFSPFQKAAAALKTFEDLLAARGSVGFLVGSNITYVDLALWAKLHELGQADKLGPGWADKYSLPRLGEFTLRIYRESRRLQAFVSSGRRMPRVKRENNDYIYLPDSPIPEPVVPKIERKEL